MGKMIKYLGKEFGAQKQEMIGLYIYIYIYQAEKFSLLLSAVFP